MPGLETYLLLGAAVIGGTAATWLNRATAVKFGFVTNPGELMW